MSGGIFAAFRNIAERNTARTQAMINKIMAQFNAGEFPPDLATVLSIKTDDDFYKYGQGRLQPSIEMLELVRELKQRKREEAQYLTLQKEAERNERIAKQHIEHELRLQNKAPIIAAESQQPAPEFSPGYTGQAFRIPNFLFQKATMGGLAGCGCESGHLQKPVTRRINTPYRTLKGISMRGQTMSEKINNVRGAGVVLPSAQDRKRFLQWLKRFNPYIYSQLHASGGPLAGLGEVTATKTPESASRWRDIIQSVKELGTVYIQGKTQKDILDAQLERMKLGLKPLETSQIAPTIHVGVDPAQVNAMLAQGRQAASDGLQKWILPGMLGIAAFFVLKQKPKRGR